MAIAHRSVPRDYFERLYWRETDPWNLRSSAYERDKYEATLAALPKPRYCQGLEIACSIGVFTKMLAARCDRLLAVDASREALQRARDWCASAGNVRFERRTIPDEYPAGTFDLTTICEVGYYLDASDLKALVQRVVAHSAPRASVLLVHWTPPVEGHASTAQEVHDAFRYASDLAHVNGYDAPTYRLDLFERR